MEFEYTRTIGEKRTYAIELTVWEEAGRFKYSSRVRYLGDFRGEGLTGFPLTAHTLDGAKLEARDRVERDIEHLAGIAE